MPVLYPEPGESLGSLARRVLDGLTDRERLLVQLDTSGERYGLNVPASAAPEPAPDAGPEPHPGLNEAPAAAAKSPPARARKPSSSRRAQRRQPKE